MISAWREYRVACGSGCRGRVEVDAVFAAAEIRSVNHRAERDALPMPSRMLTCGDDVVVLMGP